MRAALAKLKSGTEPLNYGRDIVAGMAVRHAAGLEEKPLRLLDLGLGSGADLENIRAALGHRTLELFGVDSYEPNVRAGRERGVKVVSIDIEREPLPFADASFDLVVANQILEHTKEIFWIVSEAARVLAPGGALLVGVPNLASLHSRAMLALGMQPSPIDVLGPHIRGFVKSGLEGFLQEGGFFQVVELKGSNFYPFPRMLAKPLARAFPGLAVSLFFRCRRTERAGRFIEVLDQRFFETPFFRGSEE
jgi:SAM-dependent methyltransferase